MCSFLMTYLSFHFPFFFLQVFTMYFVWPRSFFLPFSLFFSSLKLFTILLSAFPFFISCHPFWIMSPIRFLCYVIPLITALRLLKSAVLKCRVNVWIRTLNINFSKIKETHPRLFLPAPSTCSNKSLQLACTCQDGWFLWCFPPHQRKLNIKKKELYTK